MSNSFTVNGNIYTWPDQFEAYNYVGIWPSMINDCVAQFATDVNDAQAQATIATSAAAAAAASAITATTFAATQATSVTSLTIATGTQTLSVQVGKGFTAGMQARVAKSDGSLNWMDGSVAAYNSGTGAFTLDVTATSGGGTFSAWNVFMEGPIGPSGAIGISTISGFTLSNDGSLPNSVLDIAAGTAGDSTATVAIAGTAFTKSTAGVWAAGSGGNGMGTALTIANSTWYHVFAIINAGLFDVYFDTSATAANKPASTTAFRRIGSFKTDGSAHIKAFTQMGQRIFMGATVPYSGNPSPGGSWVSVVMDSPLGIITYPTIVNISMSGSSSLIINLRGGTAPTGEDWQWSFPLTSLEFSPGNIVLTDTLSQIQFNAGANVSSLQIQQSGWVDPHLAPVW